MNWKHSYSDKSKLADCGKNDKRGKSHWKILGTELAFACLVLMLGANCVQSADAADELSMIPWPVSVERGQGRLVLGDNARIMVGSAKLTPLAEVLAGEIDALFGRQVPVTENSTPGKNDIALRIDPDMAKEEYRLEVDDRVWIVGGSYAGVAAGTVTFLQSLSDGDAALALPVMKIVDAPQASYRGLMLDPARKFHTVSFLKKCIRLCRWYKIRHLQLHLTDDQSFTFPSRTYPGLATPNRHYTLEQLRDLEQYAVERGVVIVPEFDVPGHSRAAVRAKPEIFATQGGSKSTLNFARPEACQAVDTIIREMADVFRATPYFHIGSDECNMKGLHKDPHFQAALEKTGLPNAEELYRKFIVDRNETVRELGKQTIVWEGFRRDGEVEIPRNVLVMVFEGGKYYRPDHLVEDGYTIINTSWQPLYIVTRRPAPIGQWPVEHIYGWNKYRFEHFREWAPAYDPIELPSDAPVLGAQICSWENPQKKVIPYARKRLAAMSARVWNPDAERDFEDFSQRLRATDAKLDALLRKR